MPPTHTEENFVEAAVREYFIDECGIGSEQIDSGVKLFSGGLLDSLEVLKLLTFIEGTFDFKLSAFEVRIENFDSVDEIVKIVESKMAG